MEKRTYCSCNNKYRNKRIGFIAYVDKSTHPQTDSFPELFINYFEAGKVLEDYQMIKMSVDMVICSIHWGTDYSHYFTSEQSKVAHFLVNNGIDCIMGHHSHTVQPFEIYKGKPIFYSIGSLCYGDFLWEGKLRALKRKTKLGVIVTLDREISDLKIIPTKELKNNFIVIPKTNIRNLLARRYFFNGLKNKFKIVSLLILYKESYFDRILEYFIGYHINPISQILRTRNIFRKVGIIVKKENKV